MPDGSWLVLCYTLFLLHLTPMKIYPVSLHILYDKPGTGLDWRSQFRVQFIFCRVWDQLKTHSNFQPVSRPPFLSSEAQRSSSSYFANGSIRLCLALNTASPPAKRHWLAIAQRVALSEFPVKVSMPMAIVCFQQALTSCSLVSNTGRWLK